MWGTMSLQGVLPLCNGLDLHFHNNICFYDLKATEVPDAKLSGRRQTSSSRYSLAKGNRMAMSDFKGYRKTAPISST